MRIRTIVIAAGAVASIAAAGWAGGEVHLPVSFPATGAAAVTGHRAGLASISDPRKVTYSDRIGSCHSRDHGQLPDRACTPGSIDPAVTQANIGSTICRTGWTRTIRPPEAQTEHAKYDVAYPAYGIGGRPVSELDHLVPLELGGSNDITNLWPENYRGLLGAHDKDRLENYLHHAVCSGRMPLQTAQETIARDWVKAYCAARLGECPAGLR